MQRLLDHFCFSTQVLGHQATSDLPAEQENPQKELHSDSYKGQPIWFHGDAPCLDHAIDSDSGHLFDPDEAIACIQFEHYVKGSQNNAGSENGLRSLYYLLKPLLPRSLQLELQRINARKRLRSVRFPRWPSDPTLDRLFELFLIARMEQMQTSRLPFIGFWPQRKTWSWCTTHDVDTAKGYAHIEPLAQIEGDHAVRSAWYFVPQRYDMDPAVLRDLQSRGHEVGVHGVDHSGKLFKSRKEFEWRRDRINHYLAEWQVCGFRSPATYRNPHWLTELDIEYDSSYLDIATFEPQLGGVCSPFPFMLNDQIVELPITLPMDHTLQNILRQDPFAGCRDKAEWIRQRHGMALSLFHPDYNTQAHERQRYALLLDYFKEQSDAWETTPTEIARWWQARRRSNIEMVNGQPKIIGPAAPAGHVWWAVREADSIRIETHIDTGS